MKRSKPSTVVGGGEMKRATSSVDSIDSNAGASDNRRSRSVTIEPAITGRARRQSLSTVTAVAVDMTAWTSMSGSASWNGIFSMSELSPGRRLARRRDQDFDVHDHR